MAFAFVVKLSNFSKLVDDADASVIADGFLVKKARKDLVVILRDEVLPCETEETFANTDVTPVGLEYVTRGGAFVDATGSIDVDERGSSVELLAIRSFVSISIEHLSCKYKPDCNFQPIGSIIKS